MLRQNSEDDEGAAEPEAKRQKTSSPVRGGDAEAADLSGKEVPSEEAKATGEKDAGEVSGSWFSRRNGNGGADSKSCLEERIGDVGA